MVVAVLMTSCQVSDQPKIGPATTLMASRKVDDRPSGRSTHRGNRANSGAGCISASAFRSAG
jgi:hypothetical protein